MELGFSESSLERRSRTNFESGRSLRHRRCPARTMIGFQEVNRSRQKRQVLQGMVRPLKRWLVRHRENPYPTRAEKIALALGSKMTLVQVSNWFANARRRLKNTVKAPNVSWAKRVKLYNSCVEGNAELLSISSEDSIWQLDDSDHECGAVDVASASAANVDHCYSAPEFGNEYHLCSPTDSSHTAWLAEKIVEPQTAAIGPRPQTSSLIDQVNNLTRCKRALERSEKKDVDVEEDNVRVKELDCYDDRPRKYKRSILQRYLHDSVGQPNRPSSRPASKSTVHQQGTGASRKFGDSTGTFSDSDFYTSCHSSASNSGRSSIDWSVSLSDDEAPKKRKKEETTVEHAMSTPVHDNRYWKEFDAAVVLVSLGRAVP